MPPHRRSRRTESRRGVVVALVLLALLAVVVDLLRSDSAIRGAFQGIAEPASTPLERMLEGILP